MNNNHALRIRLTVLLLFVFAGLMSIAIPALGSDMQQEVWLYSYLPLVLKTTVEEPRDLSNMVLIPKGDFQMGCGSYCANSDMMPLHMVYLDAYYIDIYEVTNAKYVECVDAGACEEPNGDNSYSRNDYFGNPKYDNYPVVLVSWEQASAYCSWRDKRLPTEAEWEKAARGTSYRLYPWGSSTPTCELANGYNICSIGDTDEVGSYPEGASPYGVMDMSGNVWEWVNDWYDADYYDNSPDSNPTGPEDGTYRVMRGGSWGSINGLLTGYRNGSNLPTKTSVTNGFRCVATP